MSAEGNARVLDLKAIEHFKGVLVGFGETLKATIMEADSEIGRAINWLETDRIQHWRNQIRKRQELINIARSELYRKQMQGSEKDGRPSVVDEKKKLQQAQRALEVAQRKLETCKKWRNRLEREYSMYKGQTSMLGTIAEKNVPEGVARLDRMLDNLEQYVNEKSGAQTELSSLLSTESKESIKRSGRSQEPTTTPSEPPTTEAEASQQPPESGSET
ncbi:MAG: hypothetical protein CBC35_04605 [Planctomycetes bacterium TMED75]|nr:hypothetical protein [Planctomycetaceae bacterium]OUU94103.1 MAG: hypothetical protein CBC35_04605 [Planctomycetes bacterium TMED75]